MTEQNRSAIDERRQRAREAYWDADGADRFASCEAAIETAITHWMGWTINRETAREISMPKGLPYMKGFVLYFSLKAQAA